MVPVIRWGECSEAIVRVGDTVQRLDGPTYRLLPHERGADAVVIGVRPVIDIPAPFMRVPSVEFELHWPDGTTTWHRRWQFDPIGGTR